MAMGESHGDALRSASTATNAAIAEETELSGKSAKVHKRIFRNVCPACVQQL